MSWEIELPIPPTANNAYPTNRKTGRRYLSKRAKEWKKEAGWLIAAAGDKPAFDGDYNFHIYVPLKARGDASNYIKLAEDLCVEMRVTPDDRRARSSGATKHLIVAPKKCIVSISEAAP